MHRTVSSDDVKMYSSGARVKDMQLEKEEDIEYRSGHLYHSSGSTTVKMAKIKQRFSSRHTTLQEGPLNEELFSANGSYVLDLLRCYTVPSTAKRGRRSARKPMIRGSLEVVIDKGITLLTLFSDMHVYKVCWCMNHDRISTPAGSLAKSEMEDLRKAMPSIPHVLAKLHHDPDNSKLSMFVEFCYIAIQMFQLYPFDSFQYR